jgi:hypothetical protein
MRRSPVLVVAGCAALIVVGLVLATASASLGAVVTVAGILLLAGYLIYVFRLAWSGDQKRAWAPGSLRREAHDEQPPKLK